MLQQALVSGELPMASDTFMLSSFQVVCLFVCPEKEFTLKRN
ncbi:MAG: hypothetical protein ACI8ZB_004135 [Desulforhopalus sp.]